MARLPMHRDDRGLLGAAAVALWIATAAACSTASPSSPSTGTTASNPHATAPTAPATAPSAAANAATTSAAANATASPAAASTASLDAGPSAAPPPAIGAEQAEQILFLEEPPPEMRTCPTAPEPDRIRCLIGLRYQTDRVAAERAIALYDRTGSVAGLEQAHQMDGGWRGSIRIVPELPVRHFRRHLDWMAGGLEDIDAFFAALAEKAPEPLRYRWRPLALRYFRSVGRTTPSAYAARWTVFYNVSGSLHSSAHAVRETLFHEIFHLNDHHHGGWSRRALGEVFDSLVARCTRQQGALPSSRCLRPYAPNHTMVRGGTYYAFQPGGGVWEYAAELAVRYFREHRAILGLGPRLRETPFKCGPEENRKSWTLLAREFFGGVDLVPSCG